MSRGDGEARPAEAPHPPRRVFIVRHCQSEANRDARAETRGDSALTVLGLDQARRRALLLAEHDLAGVAIVSSPLARANLTARAIADRHGGALSHDERFREGDLGLLEGLSYGEIQARVAEGELWVSADIHGGESVETVGRRMREALVDALRNTTGPLIVVSHGYAIVALMESLGRPCPPMGNGDMLELDIELDETLGVSRHAHHPLGG